MLFESTQKKVICRFYLLGGQRFSRRLVLLSHMLPTEAQCYFQRLKLLSDIPIGKRLGKAKQKLCVASLQAT